MPRRPVRSLPGPRPVSSCSSLPGRVAHPNFCDSRPVVIVRSPGSGVKAGLPHEEMARMEPDLSAYRSLFPITKEVAYLNHAAAGPVSLPVIEAVHAFLVDRSRRASEAAPESKALAERTRAKVAAFMGAAVEEIAFMKATPDGLNAVANGIEWKDGDNV